MAIAPNEFKKMFPEFADAGNSALNIYIELADKCVGSGKFGDKRDQAVAFLAAHMFAKVNSGGATGAITKEKVGDLEVTYGNAMSNSSGDEFQTTPYGQLYWNLLRGCVITPLVSKC